MNAVKSYGCHNRSDYEPTLEVQQGCTEDGRRIKQTIQFTMARDCQYTQTELGQVDDRCNGCKWKRETQ